MNLKPIETAYKGYRFRSRLEARWAVFFDAMGWYWEYEPEGFQTSGGWYLPDFKVRGAGWVEVKPEKTISDEDWAKLEAFSSEGILLLDGPPAPNKMYISFDRNGGFGDTRENFLDENRFGKHYSLYKECWWFDPVDCFWPDTGQWLLPAINAAKAFRFDKKEFVQPNMHLHARMNSILQQARDGQVRWCLRCASYTITRKELSFGIYWNCVKCNLTF